MDKRTPNLDAGVHIGGDSGRPVEARGKGAVLLLERVRNRPCIVLQASGEQHHLCRECGRLLIFDIRLGANSTVYDK